MDEQQLIALYRSRSEQALIETNRLYGRYCYYIAYQVLHNHEDVEECLNDLLLKCWETFPEHPPENFRAYVAVTARNLAITKYRQKSRWEKAALAQNPLFLNSSSVNRVLEDGLCNTAVISYCISTLMLHQPPDNQEIFIQRYFEQKELLEIAEQLSLSEGCVKTRLFRMRGALKQLLRQNGVYTA